MARPERDGDTPRRSQENATISSWLPEEQ